MRSLPATSLIYKTTLFIVTLLYIVPSVIFSFPSATLTALVLSLFFLFKILIDNKIEKNTFIFIGYLLLCLFLLLIPFLYHGGLDNTVFKYFLYGLLSFVSSVTIISFYRSLYHENFEYYLLRNIVCVALINLALTTVILFSNSFMDVFYSVFSLSESAERYLKLGLRISGMFASGFSILSVFYALSLYLNLIIISEYELPPRVRLFYYISAVILFCGIVYSGRLGLIVIACVLTLSLVAKNNFFGLDKRLVIKIMLLSGVFSLFVIVKYHEQIYATLVWAFGVFGDNTISFIIENMLFFPKDYIIGIGSFGRGANVEYIESDLGFVLLSYYGGIFLSSFILVSFLFWAIYIQFFVRSSSRLKPFVTLLFLCHIAFNFKDVYFFGSSGVTQILFLTLSALFYKKKMQ